MIWLSRISLAMSYNITDNNLSIPKEFRCEYSRTTEWSSCRTRDGVLALTFGTLLSSQGADAHR